MKPIEERFSIKWQLQLWYQSNEILELLLPGFTQKFKHVVQVNKITRKQCKVPSHTDQWNLLPQYHITFGNFEGAALRIYNPELSIDEDFSDLNRLLAFDARIPHTVHIDKNYHGTRYALTWYVCQRAPLCPVLYRPKYLY